ncbi:MAG: pyridoxamine 5'-phosphate oxidase family protein [Gammaproteobacteria bacterium]|nr:pyridoxamine 5'-phosphate oxidase family protein [Gammaproteobacteria bacterium]
MGQQYNALETRHIEFINQQHMFFVATAPANGHINLSPKGIDSLRVIDNNTVLWLNLTGSGNETAAHMLENRNMTLMFCAFEGKPLILRLYGEAEIVHTNNDRWDQWVQYFPQQNGARQIVKLNIALVQSSCGMGVPLFEFKQQRNELTQWLNSKSEAEITEYWRKKNTKSLNGKPTGIPV